MQQTSKILWGEGLFLRPQHFQQQDAFHEWRLAEVARNLHPYAWGARCIQVDVDALASGMLRFNKLQLVFPDGELFAAPQEDELPAPVSLQQLPSGTSDIVFYAALAPLRASGSNFAPDAQKTDGSVRYTQHNINAIDTFTNADSAELAVLRKCVTIRASTEPRDNLISMPVCRLRRTATGGFELDSSYMTPSISISSSAPIQAVLRRLLDALQAKVNALYGFHREPSKHVIEFRSGDIASFWLLHTASSAFASLSHFHHQPGLHPERLFQRLLELAGSLMTFSKEYALTDLPPYQHANPTACFSQLETILQGLLDTVISTKYFSIALEELKPSFHHARMDSEKISPQTGLFISVKATMSPAELVNIVPVRFKAGAPDDVEKLVLSAMSGIRITHAPQVPSAIPVKPGCIYFSLDASGQLYDRMLKAQSMTIYVPSGIADLEMELFALNQ